MTLPDRFWAKVDKNGPMWNGSPCWLWTGAKNRKGYGRFGWHGKNVYAHRLAFSLLVAPVPAALTIDHLCDNEGCQNVAHMVLATPVVNTMRGNSLPARNARKTHCPSGHPYEEGNIYRSPVHGGRTCRTCRAIQMKKYHQLYPEKWLHKNRKKKS